MVSTPVFPVSGDGGVGVSDPSDSRVRVLRLLLESTSLTASQLARRLGVTTAAVRRHLKALDEEGFVRPVQRRSPAGPRRGRPAAAWEITANGRGLFGHGYDTLARQALAALRDTAGDEAVSAFARRRANAILADVTPMMIDNSDDPAVSATATAHAMAEAFIAHGYAVTVEHAGDGVQLCQHHCPVAQVAGDFPQLCEAEAEAISRLVGRPVQPLSTIPAGNGVCTTNIPPPLPRPRGPAVASRQPPHPRQSTVETTAARYQPATPADNSRLTTPTQ